MEAQNIWVVVTENPGIVAERLREYLWNRLTVMKNLFLLLCTDTSARTGGR
jgi:hypothetical protein